MADRQQSRWDENGVQREREQHATMRVALGLCCMQWSGASSSLANTCSLGSLAMLTHVRHMQRSQEKTDRRSNTRRQGETESRNLDPIRSEAVVREIYSRNRRSPLHLSQLV